MEHIWEYLLSVTAAALLCGILQSLTGEKGSTAGIIRLICGIFLALTVIRPIADIQLQEFSFLPSDVMEDAQIAVQEGEDYANAAKARLIKEQAEAYILDKARLYGAEITADVTLSQDDPPVPVGCNISGALSPYAKQQLKGLIADELGIPEEDQQWTVSSSSS